MAENRIPITNESIQHWIKLKGSQQYLRVTEDTSAEIEREDNTYEPTYIDRKVQPKFNVSRSDTITFEIDVYTGGGLHSELALLEDEQDVAVEYVRTLDYDFATNKSVPATALVAKHANATLNVTPLKTDDVAPIKMTVTLSIASVYDHGTFNANTGTFTPKAASATTSGSQS